MKTNYCLECTTTLGLVNPAVPISLTGTSYQLAKFIKHTAPTGTYPTNSVFDTTDYDAYRDYIVTTTVSGSSQIDGYGQVNLFWVAGRKIGATYQDGVFAFPDDAVCVVLHDRDQHIHAYPIASSGFNTTVCAHCGKPIPHLNYQIIEKNMPSLRSYHP